MNDEVQHVPLERYRANGKISWKRLSDEDKRIVAHWLRAQDPSFIPSLSEIAAAFSGDVIGFHVGPEFWTWLDQVRAWQRDRDRGVDAPRPEVPRLAA